MFLSLFYFAKAFSKKSLFLRFEILLVDLRSIEINAHLISYYAGASASQVGVKYLISWLYKLLKGPMIKRYRLLCGVNLGFLVCSSGIG